MDPTDRDSSQKIRAEFFQERTCYPARERYARELDNRPVMVPWPNWEEVGPFDIGGRLTSIAVDPKDAGRILIGAAAGGVYLTTDAGRNWRSVWSGSSPTLNIGAVAMDPTDPKVFYVGTGEANLSPDNYPGVGLFRSSDEGATWTQIGGTDNVVTRAEDGDLREVREGRPLFHYTCGLPRRIGCIAVDPSNPKHLFVGGVTHAGEENSGLYETLDGGTTWRIAVDSTGGKGVDYSLVRVKGDEVYDSGTLVAPTAYFCHAVMFDAEAPNQVYAGISAQGSQSGIWRSENGGRKWEQLKIGLPSGDQFGRMSMAMMGSTIWMMAARGTTDLLGIFRSTDWGQSWTACAPLPPPLDRKDREKQFFYNNCIAVDPANPKRCVVGLVNVYLTTDGGLSWNKISQATTHRDHHAVWISGNTVYSCNDGGFTVYDMVADRWEDRCRGLNLAMAYDMDVAQTSSGSISMGLQDQGSWASGPLEAGVIPPEKRGDVVPFRQIALNDGGWTVYDPDDEMHLFCSYQNMGLVRFRDGVRLEGKEELPGLEDIDQAQKNRVFLAVLGMDISRREAGAPGTRAIYLCSSDVWCSENDGQRFNNITLGALDGSIISAIDVCQGNANRIYVGTTRGGFFRGARQDDGSWTWTKNLAGPLNPNRIITRIDSMTEKPDRVAYVVGLVSNTFVLGSAQGTPSHRMLRGGLYGEVDGKPALFDHAHYYESEDGGTTWEMRSRMGMANLPHNALVMDLGAPLDEAGGMVTIVAHDGGVSIRVGRRSDFLPANGNLPNVRITDVVTHEGSNDVFVSTYGRGIWKTTLAELKNWWAQMDEMSEKSSGRMSSSSR